MLSHEPANLHFHRTFLNVSAGRADFGVIGLKVSVNLLSANSIVFAVRIDKLQDHLIAGDIWSGGRDL